MTMIPLDTSGSSLDTSLDISYEFFKTAYFLAKEAYEKNPCNTTKLHLDKAKELYDFWSMVNSRLY